MVSAHRESRVTKGKHIGVSLQTHRDDYLAGQSNFLAITFESVVRFSPNFESEKICMIHGLFAKAVCRKQGIHLGEKRSTWARMSCIHSRLRIYAKGIIVVQVLTYLKKQMK